MHTEAGQDAAGGGASMTASGEAISRAVELHERALVDFSAGRLALAEAAASEALLIFVFDDGPDSPDAANLSNLLAAIAEARGEYGAAAEYSRSAWTIMERLGSRCSGPEAEAIRVEALGRIGAALRSAG